jgi:arylformamidase
MKKLLNLQLLLLIFLVTGCASKKYKNVSYLNEDINKVPPTLNIFSPRNSKNDNPVLLFVHGGNWSSGDKKTYSLLGRNFAKKGVTTVIVGYTIGPNANYDEMATQVAKAVEWTEANISNYKGDPNQIFLTGHSSGGHLVALVGTNPKYLRDRSVVKGIILNDAFGLDMKSFFEVIPPSANKKYLATWGTDPEAWKNGSPIYFLDSNSPPFMIYLGKKSYDGILVTNDMFLSELHNYQPEVLPIVLNKKHIPMVLQFFFPWNKRFAEVVDFMEKNKGQRNTDHLAVQD